MRSSFLCDSIGRRCCDTGCEHRWRMWDTLHASLQVPVVCVRNFKGCAAGPSRYCNKPLLAVFDARLHFLQNLPAEARNFAKPPEVDGERCTTACSRDLCQDIVFAGNLLHGRGEQDLLVASLGTGAVYPKKLTGCFLFGIQGSLQVQQLLHSLKIHGCF